MNGWAADAVFYHIYPLGMCGAPPRNPFDGSPAPRLEALHRWIPHLRDLGVSAVYLGPLFEASAHGYDTADFFRVDRRLGDEGTLARLTGALHAAGIRVVLDGVFHHVGRDFWAFRDLREHGAASAYRDWFAGVDFGRRSPQGDAFAYDGWRGHFDLVKLNLHHPGVREHLFAAVRQWVDMFEIDGLRLDVAEDIDPGFLRDLAEFCRSLRPDFWLLGEAIHGDYRRLAGPGMLDSVTNYELYKGLHSAHNDGNLFEVAHTLDRQFGAGGLYRAIPLYGFADNHDVDRVASTLREGAHLYSLYALLFTVPGVPSIFYGSEWGIAGRKRGGDDGPLRPHLPDPGVGAGAPHPRLAEAIGRFARVRAQSAALRRGAYRPLHVAPEQLAFVREWEGERVVVAVNAAERAVALELAAGVPDGTRWTELLEGGAAITTAGGGLRVEVPPRWARILRAG